MAANSARETLSTAGERIHAALASTTAYRRFSDADLEGLYGTARSFMSAGRYDKAMSMLALCAMYRPQVAKYLVALGTCHRRLDQHEMAVQAFALAAGLDPMRYDAALQTAECLLRLRRRQEAHHVLTSLVECGKVMKEAAPFGTRAKVLLDLMEPA